MAASLRLVDLFKVGIGPSSSHTSGPMTAAYRFARSAQAVEGIASVEVRLYGSLAYTGEGHGTPDAVMLGLSGYEPDRVEPSEVRPLLTAIRSSGVLTLAGGREVAFDPSRDIAFDTATLMVRHPNALRCTARDDRGAVLLEELWYSVGGGFVERDGAVPVASPRVAPHPFTTGDELLAMCADSQLRVDEVVLRNELAAASEREVAEVIARTVSVMMSCIDRGLAAEGYLPGGLGVQRRAKDLHASLGSATRLDDQLLRISTYAIAVNEQNAAGEQVVTAPTNGAAGVIPAVLRHLRDQWPEDFDAMARTFLLAATAIGSIIKHNASISGAEVGCQGEVGSAAAMAAAGMCAALGGSPDQVEHAAEIALEHHLGMTCDPVGGLVQVPCIERNAFGATKAVLAAHMALRGGGEHIVSFDQVVETMRQTGLDMHANYRETSRGGLAVNVPEC